MAEDKDIGILLHLRHEIVDPFVDELNILSKVGVTDETQEDEIAGTLHEHRDIGFAFPRLQQTFIGTARENLITLQATNGPHDVASRTNPNGGPPLQVGCHAAYARERLLGRRANSGNNEAGVAGITVRGG